MRERAGCGCGLASDARGWCGGRSIAQPIGARSQAGLDLFLPIARFNSEHQKQSDSCRELLVCFLLICLPARGVGSSGGRYA